MIKNTKVYFRMNFWKNLDLETDFKISVFKWVFEKKLDSLFLGGLRPKNKRDVWQKMKT